MILGENGTDVEGRARNDETARSPLAQAIFSGHEDTAETLILENANVEWRNSDESLLTLAITKNQPRIFNMLLNLGADASAELMGPIPLYIDEIVPGFHSRWTAVHYAMAYNDYTASRLLFSGGANFDVQTSLGCLPLHFLAMRDDSSKSLSEHKINFQKNLQILLNNVGQCIDCTDNLGMTALHRLVKYSSCNGEKWLSSFQSLLDNGADVNAEDNCGRSPLFYAASAEQVRALLENSAKVNLQDEDGLTSLHVRVLELRRRVRPVENIKCLSILLESGADPNLGTDAQYETAWDYAVMEPIKSNFVSQCIHKALGIENLTTEILQSWLGTFMADCHLDEEEKLVLRKRAGRKLGLKDGFYSKESWDDDLDDKPNDKLGRNQHDKPDDH